MVGSLNQILEITVAIHGSSVSEATGKLRWGRRNTSLGLKQSRDLGTACWVGHQH